MIRGERKKYYGISLNDHILVPDPLSCNDARSAQADSWQLAAGGQSQIFYKFSREITEQDLQLSFLIYCGHQTTDQATHKETQEVSWLHELNR